MNYEIFLYFRFVHRYFNQDNGKTTTKKISNALAHFSGGGMNCVSCDHMRVPPWVVCVFPWGIPQLQSDWSLSCDHGLDYAS